MPNTPPVPLDADHAAFMQGGVSITMGSCSPDKIPSIVRAFGCRLSDDRSRVTMVVWRAQAEPVLADIRATGKVAVVFSLPATHRTMQLKGTDAVIGAADDGIRALAHSYRDAFVQQLVLLGYEETLMRAFMACPPDDIVTVSFTPTAAFTQTPGPDAGAPLKVRA